MKLSRVIVVLLVGIAVTARAAGLKIELPRETLTYVDAPGNSLANSRCLTCHSADYVAIQPKLSRTFWKGNVQKMQQKYGADIPDGEVDLLADYLARAYGGDTTLAPPVIPLVVSEPGLDGPRLSAKYACVSCHALDRKVVGPSFKDVAGKYRGVGDARVKLSRQISHGGGGAWGPIPMPPFPHIPNGDVNLIVEWILKL
jgi:cytochrome c551/c552